MENAEEHCRPKSIRNYVPVGNFFIGHVAAHQNLKDPIKAQTPGNYKQADFTQPTLNHRISFVLWGDAVNLTLFCFDNRF